MWKSVIFLVLLGTLYGTGQAAELADLYQAEARVFGQQRSERTEAMKSALAEVLVKVGGRSVVLSVDNVKRALLNPARLLREYRYRQLTPLELDLYLAEQSVVEQSLAEQNLAGQSLQPEVARDVEPQMISFTFDKAAVDKLLHANNLPIWGATRPAMLVWVAVQDGQERFLLGGDVEHPLNRALAGEAQRRGLPLLQPLMDLEDRYALRFADVWGAFAEPVLKASARYQTETVLLGRIRPGLGDSWRAQWTVLEGRSRESWEAEAETWQQLASQGIGRATELLAARYAPITGSLQAGIYPIMVNGVQGLADYARVSSYLDSLQQVSQAHLVRVEPGQLYFDLSIEGAAESVVKTIALGEVLRASDEQAVAGAGDAVSTYAVPGRAEKIFQLLP